MSIPELIKAARKEAKMTQGQLAEILHVDHMSVYRWETGKRSPSTDMLLKIAKALGKTVTLINQEKGNGKVQ